MTKRRLIALGLSAVMAVSLAACGSKPAEEAPAQEAPAEEVVEEAVEEPVEEEVVEEAVEEEAPAEEAKANLVYATSTFGQKFSPFFATTAFDMEVVDLTQVAALAADRGGAVIQKGIEGETINYNGTDYTYYGMGDVEVTQNDDGTVDYKLTIRDDVKFSDGEPVTIDDYIFSFYVLVDPTYDGSSTIYALPIEGMEEYRSGMDSRGNVIFAAGEGGYQETEAYTEEQYNAFWDYYNNNAGADFAQEIVDYCKANGYNGAEDTVAQCAANWGYELEEGATAQDFWDAIVAAYDTVEEAEEVETAGSTRLQLAIAALGADYETGVETGESAANVAGLTRVDDYTVNIHMTEFDATAIYNVGLTLAPLHYYGDPTAYDYENNQFGFPKGDLSGVKAVTSEPVGAGPYTFDGYANGVVTLKANPNYFQGEPETKVLLLQEALDSDYVPGIVTGSFDIAVPSINDETLKAIQDANGNGELVGDKLTTILVDYRGYGYLGINADLVNVGGDPSSDESKALRKGFMTLFSVYRDTVINSYYGDRAAVIQYPISNTSWAAPKPADEGYQQAYSVDVDGNPIYDSSMSEEQRYEAAKEAAIGYFKAAGFTYDEAAGKFTDVTDTYEVMIPGQGQQDHPAYGVAVAASEVLESLGIKLQVNDVGTSVWNNALESNTAMMWAAAWQSTVDPDMTQVYHSSNAHGAGTNSNHYSVDDPDLDTLIVEGRSSADTEYRKAVYRDAMNIIMDWGCELPLYQRKDCTVASTERIVIDTLPHDMTPYWGWYAEVQALEIQ
ncbi:MAG: ABC transporter substrate-binding protein [Lachnospiraceae bacterium]|nr:ABC transporter substrate-binding protein [Lachnospiraceae bacterium]